MKKMKILRVIIVLFVLFILVFASYLAYLFFSYHRLPDNQAIEIKQARKTTNENNDKKEYKITTFNIGYAANPHNYSFFMDGGKYARGFSKENVQQNLEGIIRQVQKTQPDFVLLQEVDSDATRSYHMPQEKHIMQAMPEMNAAFALNYDSAYLFYPFTEPIGKSQSGLLTLSREKIHKSTRYQLPIETNLNKFTDYDRAFTISLIATTPKPLALINVHLSAFTKDQSIQTAQIKKLAKYMQLYQQKGYAVIVGGDYNHDVLGDTYTVYGYGNDNSTYGLMKCNLGWVDNKQVYYNQRIFEIEFTQERSEKKQDLTVTQEGKLFDYKDVGSTYYQWGRKDPLVALKNWGEIGKDDYRPHQAGTANYEYRTEAKRVSIGESIQHPNVYYVRNVTANWNATPVRTLWNNQSDGGSINDVSSTKTIYDPSPKGFKVPVPKTFAVFVNGCSSSPGGDTPNVGKLNGTPNVGEHKNQYEVYTQSGKKGDVITLTGTGQRADLDKKLPAYTEGNADAELGGLWAMYGVYFMTCVPITETSANTFVIRHDNVDGAQQVYTYGFSGNMTMARPVRPIKETN